MAQADITDELIRIKGEERGETVRDSIISAFNKLGSTPGSVNSVNGYTVRDFVLKEDVADILPLDTELKEYGSKAVTSGAIYDYIGNVDSKLDTIYGGTPIEPYSPTSIKNKLYRIDTARKRIRGSIIAKQVEVDRDATFRSYADKIKAIPDKAEIQTSEKPITENGEYDAGKGEAYSILTVEAKPKTATKNISKVGTYQAEDDDVEAYSEVEVDISSGVTTKTITAEDLSKDSYETVIKASDEKDKETVGYSEVSIDVSGKFQELQEEVDPGGGNAEFVFDAKDEELYGYSKITITVTEITGPFTVEFYDGDSKLYTDENVPKNGTCTYKGKPKLEKKGYVFQGWEPKPVNVTKNMKTYATWKKQSTPTDFTQKTWNEIAENGGIDAVPGETKKTISWKACKIGNDTTIQAGSAIATCVYVGEEGTNSTWVMKIELDDYAIGGSEGLKFIKDPGSLPSQGNGMFENGNPQLLSYEQSKIYNFFRDTFVNAILQCDGQEQMQFRDVNKYTLVCDKNGEVIERKINCGPLWLLSAKEMGDNNAEKKGITYPDFVKVEGLSRSMNGLEYGKWNGNIPQGLEVIANEKIWSEVKLKGDNSVGYDCPAHLWWATKVYDYYESTGTIPGGIWTAVRDRVMTFEKGYLGTVYVGFCL